MPTVASSNLVTTLAPSPDATQAFYMKDALVRAKYQEHYARWADSAELKEKSGKIAIMRRWLHLAMALSPLAEGVPPTGKVPSPVDFQAAVQQFGDYIVLSDYADMTGIDDYVRHWNGLLGEQAGYTEDAINRDVATAGTSVIYSNGAARNAVLSIVDENDLDRVIRTLSAAGAEKSLAGNSGSSTVGSTPIMPAYPAVTLPDVTFDLQNLQGFKWASDYRGSAEGEIGRYKQIAFFESPDPSSLGAGGKKFVNSGGASVLVQNTAGVADVFTIMVFGKHGFTRIPLSGNSMKMYHKGLGTSGALDPLDQIQTLGWKLSSARLRTNESFLMRVECAASI